MMDQIARSLANVIIFLEYASADVLDEDCSIQALEQLAGDLNALDQSSRRALAASFRLIASSYSGEIKTFVEELPDALGLEEPRDEAS